jgi:hypothetical protein
MSGTRQKEPGSTEGCQEPDRRNQGAQKDVRNQTEGTREHRRMSGSCLSSWEPWELSVIHHSTEGCQEPDRRNQGAQKDVRELPVITGSPGSSLSLIHKFINSYIYNNVYNIILSRNTKIFQEKQKFFRFFLQVSKIVCIFAPSKVN